MDKEQYEIVKQAMDIHAKRLLIIFGEWIRLNGWFPQGNLYKPDCWGHFNYETEKDKQASTEELYDIFIKEMTTNTWEWMFGYDLP
jgi:hypothetical protein